MSDDVTVTVPAPAAADPAPVADPIAAPAVSDADAILAKVKAILVTAGHDVEKVWDEVVALAKKVA